jgi:rRNA maturation RNase YbeY
LAYRVEFNVQAEGAEVPDLRRLGRLARMVLAVEGAGPGEVGVVLTDDAGIAVLNEQYLGHEGPTDVISFGMQEQAAGRPDLILPEEASPYLGDVAISLERAREQAAAYGHPWTREVELLLVHGLLHLLGYDDGEEPARKRMHARQEQLLDLFEARHSMLDTFRAAFAGLGNSLVTQRNVRIHVTVAAAAVILGAVLGFVLWEWAVLVLTIALVLVTEALNSAAEALVDLTSPERRPLAGRVKDLGAAAVLLAAIFAIIVGAILFLPHLWALVLR